MWWRANLALFAAGLATFGLMYCVQPLLPEFAAGFGVAPATAALVLSATTLVLAVSLLGASVLADRLGRKPVMVASLLASGALCAVSARAPGLAALVAARAAMGVTLAGVPAVAMAYVAEEMAPAAAAQAIGLFIGGSAVGGMSGRLFAAAAGHALGWRAALAAMGGMGLICGLLLWRFLPPSRHHAPARHHPLPRARRADAAATPADAPARQKSAAGAFAGLLATGHVRRLAGTGFLLMGGFIALYNYLAFRLIGPPFRLTQAEAGLVFMAYLPGALASSTAGRMVMARGHRSVLTLGLATMAAGVALTLAPALAAVVLGTALATMGFFAAHAAASGWVAASGGAARAQATALYLFCYYAGSGLLGPAGGLAWGRAGWPGVVALVLGLIALAALIRPPPRSPGSFPR